MAIIEGPLDRATYMELVLQDYLGIMSVSQRIRNFSAVQMTAEVRTWLASGGVYFDLATGNGVCVGIDLPDDTRRLITPWGKFGVPGDCD